MDFVRRFPRTTVVATVAILITAAAVMTDIDVLSLNLGNFERITKGEVDELVIVWALVFTAYGVDLAVRSGRRAERLQAEQLRVVHVTMRTVQDIVGNCLTELQLLRMHADAVVPAEALALFDESIRMTTGRLRELGELETYAERHMALGPGLHIEASVKAPLP